MDCLQTCWRWCLVKGGMGLLRVPCSSQPGTNRYHAKTIAGYGEESLAPTPPGAESSHVHESQRACLSHHLLVFSRRFDPVSLKASRRAAILRE
jgi:hypothetical protein